MQEKSSKLYVERRMPFDEIEELKNAFVKDLLPEKVYLFGSFAEGRANEESDYDFYIVVVNDSEKDMLRLTTRAYKAIRDKQHRPVDIIINTSKTFEERKKRASSVESEVAKKGVLLYG